MLLQADVVMTSILEFRNVNFEMIPVSAWSSVVIQKALFIPLMSAINFASDGAGGENSGARLPHTLKSAIRAMTAGFGRSTGDPSHNPIREGLPIIRSLSSRYPLATFRFGSSYKRLSRPTWWNEISAVTGVLSNCSLVKFGSGG